MTLLGSMNPKGTLFWDLRWSENRFDIVPKRGSVFCLLGFLQRDWDQVNCHSRGLFWRTFKCYLYVYWQLSEKIFSLLLQQTLYMVNFCFMPWQCREIIVSNLGLIKLIIFHLKKRKCLRRLSAKTWDRWLIKARGHSAWIINLLFLFRHFSSLN